MSICIAQFRYKPPTHCVHVMLHWAKRKRFRVTTKTDAEVSK